MSKRHRRSSTKPACSKASARGALWTDRPRPWSSLAMIALPSAKTPLTSMSELSLVRVSRFSAIPRASFPRCCIARRWFVATEVPTSLQYARRMASASWACQRLATTNPVCSLECSASATNLFGTDAASWQRMSNIMHVQGSSAVEVCSNSSARPLSYTAYPMRRGRLSHAWSCGNAGELQDGGHECRVNSCCHIQCTPPTSWGSNVRIFLMIQATSGLGRWGSLHLWQHKNRK